MGYPFPAPIVSYFSVTPGLAGTYRVGANRDFGSINDVLNALYSVGVSGNCIFELTDDEYNERS